MHSRLIVNKRLVLAYFIGGIVWIFFIDDILILLNIMHDPYALKLVETIIFIVVSSYLLYSFIKQTEYCKKAEEDENQLSLLINSMPDFVCFKDGDGRWLKVNDFGRDLYHLNEVDYIGKTDADLGVINPFFKEAFDECLKSDNDTWKQAKITRADESFILPNEETKTFDVIKVPLFYDSGERKGLVIIGRDITQQKLTEAMLLKKEKLSVIGEMAAGIAHEIRNPLTGVKGFLQLMRENNTASKDHLSIIMSEMDRINHIVSELLVLSKPQPKKYNPFLLSESLSYVCNITSHEAKEKGIIIDFGNDSYDPTVFGDRNQLIQVFINIVKNAIDAMPRGGRIDISVNNIDQKFVKVIVVDDGIGIPKERLNKIGEPFFTLKEKGMGLGLTISNKIINEHKGTINIKSVVTVGTTVSITLPVYNDHVPEACKSSNK
ncbi:ATP-binding protein [Cytobacillus sp. IB215316]|uniref:ATP-binding protein n=1 Tax=Cytobacillus sp. IB215316 TaxID=3097354 RepID=UPI002A1704C2|nr:ATP-binding protein [Cytobacillus sp. IB215316]MDX8360543.1 ATP-binding protein [Cytobacillus sp. IB215316]